MSVRVPKPKSIELAIRIYYENIILTNSDIKKLFGRISNATIIKLKNIARDNMAQKGKIPYNATVVDTYSAYEAWGLDIKDLEHRYKKILSMQAIKN